MIRTISAKDLIKEFEKTYGSIEQLEKVLEKGEGDINGRWLKRLEIFP
ncbi:hypothetical protein [Methanobrevibacter cuticularis]|nr:hypothetical protein [Methanobrevibacter cuticularis]